MFRGVFGVCIVLVHVISIASKNLGGYTTSTHEIWFDL